jgi:hypothetical protein
MQMGKSAAIGIDMPNDFHTDAHNEVVTKLGPYKPQSAPNVIWDGLVSGWNAVAIRFKTVANADEKYTVSIRSKEAFSSSDERVVQQEALFAFFVNGYAALESFAYAAFAMGAMLRPADFPMSTQADLRVINLNTTNSRFTTNFSGTVIQATLSALVRDANFCRWGLIRNVLAHRSEPPRQYHLTVGGRAPHKAVWEIIDGVSIDDQTTASNRRWLATALAECITAAEAFVTANFT